MEIIRASMDQINRENDIICFISNGPVYLLFDTMTLFQVQKVLGTGQAHSFNFNGALNSPKTNRVIIPFTFKQVHRYQMTRLCFDRTRFANHVQEFTSISMCRDKSE